MSEKVLARVLYNTSELPNNSKIELEPATLEGFSRSALIDEDYPAVIAKSGEHVNGILVRNLSKDQVITLDKFEGDEYERQQVEIAVKNSGVTELVNCYIWVHDLERLKGVDWDYNEFLRARLDSYIESEMQDM
ncbi:hypothetical protein V1511DRAFT_358284 [Dipodascopsis uninucleata]